MVNEHRFMTGLNNVSWGQINADGSISAEAIKPVSYTHLTLPTTSRV